MESQVKYGLFASSIIVFSLLGYGYYLQNYTVKDDDGDDGDDGDDEIKKSPFCAETTNKGD
jgi:hypothetical protein